MFQPYTGPWTFDHAAHLLRRTIYGPTKARIKQAVDEGLEGTLDTLFGPPPPVNPPVYYDFENDPYAGIGETWVGEYIPQGVADVYFSRYKTILNWIFMQMNRNDQTITEKLTLFWHNHFVIVDSGQPNMIWNYWMLLREFGLGDFKEFTKRITVDQCMLIYLNGTQNNAAEPNENYARELLELFTIGKGDLVAEGDYTNYTEQDIAAFAKALTGWKAWNGTFQSHHADWAHDNSTKQLSHRFGNQTIPDLGEEEYKRVIDIIFEQDEVSRHLCRRLYIWFVDYRITPEIESQVIEPMAQVLRDNNYHVAPALRALLQSEHFHDAAMRGCMIKNTYDLLFSVYNTLEVFNPEDFAKENAMWLGYYYELQKLGMAFLNFQVWLGGRLTTKNRFITEIGSIQQASLCASAPCETWMGISTTSIMMPVEWITFTFSASSKIQVMSMR